MDGPFFIASIRDVVILRSVFDAGEVRAIEEALLELEAELRPGAYLRERDDREQQQNPWLKSNRVYVADGRRSTRFDRAAFPLVAARFAALLGRAAEEGWVSRIGGATAGGRRFAVEDLHVSVYGHGDHYIAHRDVGRSAGVTINALFCIGDPAFEGGALTFASDREDDIEEIPFEKNSVVVFPCDRLHQVDHVRGARRYVDARFSIQCWPEIV